MTDEKGMPGSQLADRAKPTVEGLGIDLSAQEWQRSGTGNGAIEVAVVRPADGAGAADGAVPADGAGDPEWVLMRVCGDPAGLVLVYDRHEWECFLDGVRGGEFDAAVR